jgi:hypothetical protein
MYTLACPSSLVVGTNNWSSSSGDDDSNFM